MIPWRRVMGKVYAQEVKQRKSRSKNHAETLKRMRLTRFGWQRRRQRYRGRYKHRRLYASKQQSKSIQYLHRSDMKLLHKCSWYFRLKVRDFPRDGNINLKPTRELAG